MAAPSNIRWVTLLLCVAPLLCHAEFLPPEPLQNPPQDVLKAQACPPTTERSEREMLDKAQAAVYGAVCGSGVWLDKYFADDTYLRTERTYGRLSIGVGWDEREGFDPELRMRARIPLPAFENKLRLLIGRGTQRQDVEPRDEWEGPAIPEAFRNVDDPAWLLGLGYGRDTSLEEGWEFDVGVRIRANPDLIGRTVYRKDWAVTDDALSRFRQTFFWRATRGLGSTTEFNVDHLLTERFMLRWANSGTVAQDLDGLEWATSFTLYQDLPKRRWLSYTSFVRGQTASELPVNDFGLQMRFRTPVFREWLFLELTGSGTWPRYFEEEERKFNPGVFARLEMYFGPAPDSYVR